MPRQLPHQHSLNEVRAKYERGLIPLAVIDQWESRRLLVILRDPYPQDKREDGPDWRRNPNNYHCHRYSAGYSTKEWYCSLDGQNVPLAAVFSWLNAPQALTTQPEHYVQPEPVTDDETE